MLEEEHALYMYDIGVTADDATRAAGLCKQGKACRREHITTEQWQTAFETHPPVAAQVAHGMDVQSTLDEYALAARQRRREGRTLTTHTCITSDTYARPHHLARSEKTALITDARRQPAHPPARHRRQRQRRPTLAPTRCRGQNYADATMLARSSASVSATHRSDCNAAGDRSAYNICRPAHSTAQ